MGPDSAWVQGYACAVATLQKLDGSKLLTTDVSELVRAGGLNETMCKLHNVDPSDVEVLFPKAKVTGCKKCSGNGWVMCCDPPGHMCPGKIVCCDCDGYRRVILVKTYKPYKK